MGRNNIYTTNQDIRDYMADHNVTQRMLAEQMGVNQYKVNAILKNELTQKEKEDILRHIDAIVADRTEEDTPAEEYSTEQDEEESTDTKFQIGDRVKYPASTLKIGIVADIWQSFASQVRMYTVRDEGDGHCAMFSEAQLEPAPLPIEFRFEAHIDGNVAVATMTAIQGEKEWVYARGHAHIIHDGPVGLAQAISYASRRMFEALDKKQTNKIYFK
jgi:hypothetical protein